jgi:hypothetical protein
MIVLAAFGGPWSIEADADHGQQAAPLVAKRIAHYKTA